MSGSWIRGFSRVERLVAAAYVPNFEEQPPSFHSTDSHPSSNPSTWMFSLILSFPLLEDLVVIAHHGVLDGGGDGSEKDDILTTSQLPIPPTFAGSLDLYLKQGVKPIACRLLSLPGGIHSQKLTLTCFSGEGLVLITALVEGCSHTLESLDISDTYGTSVRHLRPHLSSLSLAVQTSPASFDLSEATKLKVFSAWTVGGQTVHCNTPNHHAQASGPPADHDSYTLLLDLRHAPCRHR
jgi:hypothetical protein